MNKNDELLFNARNNNPQRGIFHEARAIFLFSETKWRTESPGARAICGTLRPGGTRAN